MGPPKTEEYCSRFFTDWMRFVNQLSVEENSKYELQIEKITDWPRPF